MVHGRHEDGLLQQDRLVIPCSSPIRPARMPDRFSLVINQALHNHNPVWSPDGQWIYFIHGYADGRDGCVADSFLRRGA